MCKIRRVGNTVLTNPSFPLCTGIVVNHLIFEQFPSSPYTSFYGGSIILHATVISTTPRMFSSWQFGEFVYSMAIREDPFCNEEIRVSYF